MAMAPRTCKLQAYKDQETRKSEVEEEPRAVREASENGADDL